MNYEFDFSFLDKINDLIVPIVFSALAIIFFFAIFIILIREKESTVTGKRDEDFIDRFVKKKKLQLKGIPGAPKFKIYVLIACASSAVLAILAYLFFGFGFGIVLGALLGLIIPEVIVTVLKKQNDSKFDEEYGRALKQMASVLRSGMTVQQAVEDVCANQFLDKRIRNIFIQIDADVKVGFSMADAFMRAAEETPTPDTKDMAAAVAMQTLVGGSEARLVDVVANNINKRVMTRKEVKTMFSGASMTVLTMDVMPPVLLIYFINSTGDMMNYYFESFLNTLILVAFFVMMIVGTFVSHGMINKAKAGIQ